MKSLFLRQILQTINVLSVWNLKIDLGTIFWAILTLHPRNSKSSLPTTGTFRDIESHIIDWKKGASLQLDYIHDWLFI